MHSPVFEAQSEKSQSLNLDGGLRVLATSNSFRTRLTAQILVNKISVIFSLKTAHVLSNSCVNSRFCSSLSYRTPLYSGSSRPSVHQNRHGICPTQYSSGHAAVHNSAYHPRIFSIARSDVDLLKQGPLL